jgi:hypothetical protein
MKFTRSPVRLKMDLQFVLLINFDPLKILYIEVVLCLALSRLLSRGKWEPIFRLHQKFEGNPVSNKHESYSKYVFLRGGKKRKERGGKKGG